jgi:hypothetical protein
MALAASPYDTVVPLKVTVPAYVTDEDDILRVRAYVTYSGMWDNLPTIYDALLRSGDDPLSRRAVPVVREIIEATNRYLGQGMETVWTAIPGNTVTDEQMATWTANWNSFWAREEGGIKFLSSKRWMLIKGDTVFHVTADTSKPEGSRVRLTEVEPEQYFPIWDPADGERLLGVYLASVVQDDEGNDIVQRIEYRKVNSQEQADELAAPLGGIWYRLGFYETDGWDDRAVDADPLKPVDPPEWAPVATDPTQDPLNGFALDARITAIPVYHIRNRRRGGRIGRFGISDMQGLETLFAGIIQNTSDEDLTVAMDGIGVYYTTSGKPRDEQGNVVPWVIGPGSIAELEPDGTLGRVPGVGSIQPYQDHIGYLTNVARATNGAPAVASGNVPTDVALSGVALRIHFMPVIAANSEREAEMASKWSQLLYGLLNMWFPVYEGWEALPLQPSVVFGDPLPPDRNAIITEISTLVTLGIVTKEWAAQYLAEQLGYDFPKDMVKDAMAEQQAALDAEAQQIAANAGQVPGGSDSTDA